MEDRCVCCGDTVPEGRQVCPKCSGEYNERPALSRADGKTNICPDCGTKEALDAARPLIGSGMNDQQWEEYKESIIEKIHASRKKKQS